MSGEKHFKGRNCWREWAKGSVKKVGQGQLIESRWARRSNLHFIYMQLKATGEERPIIFIFKMILSSLGLRIDY